MSFGLPNQQELCVLLVHHDCLGKPPQEVLAAKKVCFKLFHRQAEFLGDKHKEKLWCTRDMKVYSFLEFDGFLRIGM